jgi:hypothetical protein
VLLGLRPQQQWPPGRGAIPRPTEAGKPCGMDCTLSLRALRPHCRTAVNCPLPGLPGLRSSLGGEAASTWESSSVVLYVNNTAELVSSSWFVQCVHCILYSVYVVQCVRCTVCTLYSAYVVQCVRCTVRTLYSAYVVQCVRCTVCTLYVVYTV